MNRWITLGMASVFAIAVAGCGGGGGGDSSADVPVTPPAQASNGATVSVAPPAGTPIDAATLTSDQWAQLAPKGAITSVTTDGQPVVTFQVTDANNRGIKGLGFTNKSATAKYTSLSNLAFTMAKLVPGSNGSPSKWVSYIVISPAATTTAADAPTRPSSDNKGTLVDNGDGTYKYTFWTDISKVKAFVDGATYVAPNKAADLGDLAYDPAKLHRVVIQLSGNARGTGTNTPDASNSGVTGVPIGTPANLVMDLWPAAHTAVGASGDPAGRDIVQSASCFECHQEFSFHGGARQDTRYCDVCHTDQRRYGRTEAATTATGYSGSTYVVMGRTVGNLPNEIHKIHMAERLTKTGYNYANVLFNDITYPQPVQNCTKCHDGSAGAKNKTAQGDNWKNVPTRLACGACHDGIDFATGKGLTLADAEAGLATSQYGHIGGAQADDSKCALCHSSAAIPIYHVTVDNYGANGRGGYPLNTATNVPTPGFPSGQGPSIPLAAQMNMPAGVYKINYDIKQVTVAGAAGAKKATVVYRVLKDGQPVTFNASGNLITDVDGSPGVYIVYAVPQDGIATPADWNAQKTASVKALRDGTSGNSQTGPDASGYYTATLGAVIPDNAAMVTAAIGVDYNGFVQLNLPDYPKGIRLREPAFVTKVADGYTPRRSHRRQQQVQQLPRPVGCPAVVPQRRTQQRPGLCAWRVPRRQQEHRSHRCRQQLRRRLVGCEQEPDPWHPWSEQARAAVHVRSDR